MLELESPGSNEQLERAVTPHEVVQSVATRAAMLKRQGIDSNLAYSARVVQELNATYERERTDRMLARWCGVAVLALVFAAFVKWIA